MRHIRLTLALAMLGPAAAAAEADRARLRSRRLMGAHCTGLEAVYRLRALLGLERGAAVVGAVGARWSTAKGL